MPTPIVVLFYLWLAVSVVVLIRRFVLRRRRPTKVVGSSAHEATIPLDWAPTDASTRSAAAPPQWPDPATNPVSPPPNATPPPAPPSASPPPTPPPPTPPPPVPPLGPASAAAARVGSASLMEALAGISLPCDLLPLTTAEGRVLSARDLLLSTNGHSGFEVGRALGEAMRALGYTVTPMANNDFTAVRGNDRISVAIHDRPEGLLAGKRQEFPTAKPGDVIVELRL